LQFAVHAQITRSIAGMGDQDPVILASYGSHRGGVNALHFRPHMKHVVSGGADSAVLLWSLHCRPNLRHPVVRPYRFLGHQVIILPQFCNPLSNYQMIISHETRN
jgi:centriolar protein POC1